MNDEELSAIGVLDRAIAARVLASDKFPLLLAATAYSHLDQLWHILKENT